MAVSAAKKLNDVPQKRRLLGLAAAYANASRTLASKICWVTPQIMRDIAVKFNAHVTVGLIDRKAPWQKSWQKAI